MEKIRESDSLIKGAANLEKAGGRHCVAMRAGAATGSAPPVPEEGSDRCTSGFVIRKRLHPGAERMLRRKLGPGGIEFGENGQCPQRF
jgi:hypothetical protein